MNPIVEKVLISVGSGLVLALLSLLFQRVRTALFYKRVEYDLIFTKPESEGGLSQCSWDIQWEDYRLTLKIGDISNDKLENVTLIRNKGKQVTYDVLVTSERFTPVFDNEIYFKLNSIIRAWPPVGPKTYILRFVFRRRIWQ